MPTERGVGSSSAHGLYRHKTTTNCLYNQHQNTWRIAEWVAGICFC